MKIFFLCILLQTAVFSFGQSNLLRGEELMMQNNPAGALVFLENAVAEAPGNITARLYLGIVYEQLGRPQDAINTYRQALPMAGNLSVNVANNLGNVFFRMGNNEMAEQYFSQAIGFNSAFPSAFLGRANTRLRAGDLLNAIADYERYLALAAGSRQRGAIEQLISVIRNEIAAEEMRRVAAEEEARRFAAEQQRLAEERQRILDAVSASLQNVADMSQGLSLGAESIEIFEGEFQLE